MFDRATWGTGGGAPLFNDLGSHHYPVTTCSALAQRYSDQGLILTYGFNPRPSAPSAKRSASTPTAPCASGARPTPLARTRSG
jgi:hypothetical protein